MLTNFILSPQYYTKFQRETGIDIEKLLDYYGYNTRKIRSFNKMIPMKLTLSVQLKILMKFEK